MKKAIFKTAIIAVFAMALMAASAMALPVDAVELGKFGVSGTATAQRLDDGTIYAFTFNEYLRPIGGTSYDPKAYGTFLSATGIFEAYLPDPTWHSDGVVVHSFPQSDTFEFRNIDEDGILKNHDNLLVYNSGWVSSGTYLGDAAEIGFYTTEFILIDATNPGHVSLTLNGYIMHADFGTIEAEYRIGFLNTSDDDTNWNITFDVVAYEAPEVPEPGTLVLLGTGLLGAAIIARRKMKK